MNVSRGGKARGGRRRTMHSHTPLFPSSSDLAASDNPVAESPSASAARTPQTAPPARHKTLMVSTPSFSSEASTSPTLPLASPRAASFKKRARPAESLDGYAQDEEDEANRKGGHSLRKRVRVDYTFDQAEEDANHRPRIPSLSSSSVRGRKRRTDLEEPLDEPLGPTPKRRMTEPSLDLSSAARRKNPARRAPESRPFPGLSHDLIDDNDVQDTIEVGGVELSKSPENSPNANAPGRTFPEQGLNLIIKVPLPPGVPDPSQQREQRHQDQELPKSSFVASPEAMARTPSPPNEISHPHTPVTPTPLPLSVSPTAGQTRPTIKLGRNRPGPLVHAQHLSAPQHSSTSSNSADTRRRPEDQANELIGNGSVQGDMGSSAQRGLFIDPHQAVPDSSTHEDPQPQSNEAEEQVTSDKLSPSVNGNVRRADSSGDNEVDSTGAALKPWRHLTAYVDGVTIHPESRYLDENEPSDRKSAASEAEENEDHEAEHANEVTEGPAAPTKETTASELPNGDQRSEDEEAAETADQTMNDAPLDDESGEAAEGAADFDDQEEVENDNEADGDVEEAMETKTSNEERDEDHDNVDDAGDETTTHHGHAEIGNPASQDDTQESNMPTPQLEPSIAGTPALQRSPSPTAPDSPTPLNDSANGDGPVLGQVFTQASSVATEKKQEERFFKFPKLRDQNDFREVLEQHKNMSDDQLIEMLEVVNDSLLEMQEEYFRMGMIVDDFENQERRRQHDATQNSNDRRTDKVFLEKDFQLRGYNAKMTAQEKEVAYWRQQDMVQAEAYGFVYDPHPSKVANQDPVAQREPEELEDGTEVRRSLRNEPRQTAKATDVEDPSGGIVTGKRARKPREMYDPATSRSAVPAPRLRRGKNAAQDDDFVLHQESTPGAHDGEGTPKSRNRGRVARKKFAELEAEPAEYEPVAALDAQDENEAGTGKGRKRVRRSKAQVVADEHVKFADVAYDKNGMSASHGPLSGRPAENGGYDDSPVRRNKRIVTLKTKAGALTSLSNAPSYASTDATEASRPTSSSSSTSTTSTADSTYSFRPKRQRKFADQDEEEAAGGQPKKRVRRNKKHGLEEHDDEDAFGDRGDGSHHRTNGGKPSVSGKSMAPPKLRIKVIKSGTLGKEATPHQKARKTSSSSVLKVKSKAAAVPASPTADVQDGDEEKDYSKMTKSEKMSHSMRSRWASGSMQQAVDKRKATLAKKKAAKAAEKPGVKEEEISTPVPE